MHSSDAERLARHVASARRMRLGFGVAAIVVPAVLFGLFARQEERVRALADHGVAATAVVERAFEMNGDALVEYSYAFGGERYTWSVGQEDAPYPPGASFAITVLPEVPSFSRPGASFSAEALARELRPGVSRGIPAGAFALCAGVAWWSHLTLRRLGREGLSRPRVVDPDTAGPKAGVALAALFLAIVLLVNLDDGVVAVQTRLFGERPLGLPVGWVVALVEAVLGAPAFVVLPHVMRIVLHHQQRGGALGKASILLAVWRAPPALRRSRAIAIGGFAYFCAIVAAWIAFTAARGV
jgi:hypothetical protein